VSNAVRHGAARSIRVVLRAEGDQVLLSVADDGRGFTEQPGEAAGLGLRTMRYRAAVIAGSLKIGPNPAGRGTEVTCTVRRATTTTATVTATTGTTTGTTGPAASEATPAKPAASDSAASGSAPVAPKPPSADKLPLRRRRRQRTPRPRGRRDNTSNGSQSQ
jgi:hypothetical protein